MTNKNADIRRKPRTAARAVPRLGEGKRGPEGHLGYLVRQANVAVRAAMEKALSDLDVTPPQFAERFVAAWDVTVTPDAFLREFRTWTRGFLPGAREVLTALRGRFRLACLSNSNATHWERNAYELGLFTHFEAALASHALGCHKPDPLIYSRALAALHVAPEAVVFFDDGAANVEAAREVGIAAFQVAGVAELRTCLSALGLLHGPEHA